MNGEVRRQQLPELELAERRLHRAVDDHQSRTLSEADPAEVSAIRCRGDAGPERGAHRLLHVSLVSQIHLSY